MICQLVESWLIYLCVRLNVQLVVRWSLEYAISSKVESLLLSMKLALQQVLVYILFVWISILFNLALKICSVSKTIFFGLVWFDQIHWFVDKKTHKCQISLMTIILIAVDVVAIDYH